MNLLPKRVDEFRQKLYWDGFFKQRRNLAFEWYGEYSDLCEILHRYIKPHERTLVVGCGNSKLSSDMFDVGYEKLTNIDISDVVVRQMQKQHSKERPGLLFLKMDVTDMSFDDSAFDAVLDKGTLDTLMVNHSEEVIHQVDLMLSEISRVLRTCGRYVCISLLQPHILKHLVDWFAIERGWPIRILRIAETDHCHRLPVFAIILTKFTNMGANPLLEMNLSCVSSTHITRAESPSHLMDSVFGLQQWRAMLGRDSKQNNLGGDSSLDLVDPISKTTRYSLFVVDFQDQILKRNKSRMVQPSMPTCPFAVFIVPEGRESDWMFCSTNGRLQLAASAGAKRLVVVLLHRNQVYDSIESVRKELDAYIMELSPPDLPKETQIPYLSLSNSENPSLNLREEIFRGTSLLSGNFVVENVRISKDDDTFDVFRRLIFLDKPRLIQSEALLKQIDCKKRKKFKNVDKYVVDLNFLACSHHAFMVGCLGLFDSINSIRVLIIGLGGGALASFISSVFDHVRVDVIEIDPSIVSVAKEYFGFKPNNIKLRVYTQDGFDYILNLAKDIKLDGKYEVIMFDIDNKDVSLGMSCPPSKFVAKDFLFQVLKCLRHDGVFVMNLVCRDEDFRKEVVLSNLKDVFSSSILSYQIPNEVNEILYCSGHRKIFKDDSKSRKKQFSSILQSFDQVNKICKVEKNVKQLIEVALNIMKIE